MNKSLCLNCGISTPTSFKLKSLLVSILFVNPFFCQMGTNILNFHVMVYSSKCLEIHSAILRVCEC